MWLNGFAGSGKSVLCSTAIQFALRYRKSDPKVGIAFFYFTFNDESKQEALLAGIGAFESTISGRAVSGKYYTSSCRFVGDHVFGRCVINI